MATRRAKWKKKWVWWIECEHYCCYFLWPFWHAAILTEQCTPLFLVLLRLTVVILFIIVVNFLHYLLPKPSDFSHIHQSHFWNALWCTTVCYFYVSALLMDDFLLPCWILLSKFLGCWSLLKFWWLFFPKRCQTVLRHHTADWTDVASEWPAQWVLS